jgi:hypothetical protein
MWKMQRGQSAKECRTGSFGGRNAGVKNEIHDQLAVAVTAAGSFTTGFEDHGS